MSPAPFERLMLPILNSLSDGFAHSQTRILEELDRYVEFSDSTLESFKGAEGSSRLNESVDMALSHLVRAELIEVIGEGEYKVSPLGRVVLNKRLNSLDIEFLRRLPGYDV